jgi:hypothetical protein
LTSLAPLRSRLGDVAQIASGRIVRLQDGPEDGVRAVDVRVAGGIHALVLADRGMDIGPAWYQGHPLGWQSPTGVVHPAYFRDDVWLRSFHGGLLFTAGLQNVGNPATDGAESHGLHGRISNVPAHDVRAEVRDDGDGLAVVVQGSVRETTVYGVDLVLHRRLRFPAGEPVIEIHDEIENRGFTDAPVFVLYHFNVGHPIVDEGSSWIGPPHTAHGWDETSQSAEGEHGTFTAPDAAFPVQVFEHRLADAASTSVTVGIVNDGYPATDGIGLTVTYDATQLPRLWQWRMLGEGLYLTGIEPANCGLLGRVAERESGTVQMLAPMERLTFDLTVRAATGAALRERLV